MDAPSGGGKWSGNMTTAFALGGKNPFIAFGREGGLHVHQIAYCVLGSQGMAGQPGVWAGGSLSSYECFTCLRCLLWTCASCQRDS